MRFKQYINEEISKPVLDKIEGYADRLFRALNIDVVFTKHFFDRVNDIRNNLPIDEFELRRLFREAFTQYGKHIADLGIDAEAVLNDMKTDINMPFVLTWDSKNKEIDLVSKTIMRKKNFKSRNKKLRLR